MSEPTEAAQEWDRPIPHWSTDPFATRTTIHGIASDEVRSALHKHIRLGRVEEAINTALELARTDVEHEEMMWSRLQILAAEDVGMGDPMAPAIVRSLREGVLDADEGSYDRLVFAAQAAGYLARALKDPVNVEIMQTQLLAERAPEIPPEAICVHTRRGQEAGRDHVHVVPGHAADRTRGAGPRPHVARPAGGGVPAGRPAPGAGGGLTSVACRPCPTPSPPSSPRSSASPPSSPRSTTRPSSPRPTRPSGPSPMCSPTSGRVRWSSPGASATASQGVETPDDFNASVWAEWDAKSPRAQVDDALAADAAFAAQVAAVPQADRDRFTTAFGPMTIGFDQAVGMRLSEHLLHEWDVRVTLDPSAALAADGAAHVIGNLGPIVAFAGKPTGGSDTVVIATTDPEGQWAVTTTPDGVSFDRIDTWDQVHVTMPTEALVRLIYGRLCPGAHARLGRGRRRHAPPPPGDVPRLLKPRRPDVPAPRNERGPVGDIAGRPSSCCALGAIRTPAHGSGGRCSIP